MKKVFSAQDIVSVSHLKNILESYGIDCIIRNEFLSGGAGELPLTECWPELWVVDENHAPQADSIIASTCKVEDSTPLPWRCPRCGETLEGQFGSCWKCGASQTVAE